MAVQKHNEIKMIMQKASESNSRRAGSTQNKPG